MTPAGARFHDRDALIAWAFAVVWDAAVVLLAWVVTSEHAGWRGWLALAVFGSPASVCLCSRSTRPWSGSISTRG